MVKIVRVLVLPLAILFALLLSPAANAATSLPNSMAALGDSITRAADVCCWYADHPADSWSTGHSPDDGVYSQYERLVALHPVITNRLPIAEFRQGMELLNSGKASKILLYTDGSGSTF